MPDESSVDRAVDISAIARSAMAAIGFIPVLHLVATLSPVVLVMLDRLESRYALLSAPILYLVPPLVVRATTSIRPLPGGSVDLGSRAFLYWWFTAQWQMVFARLPLLEELLRLLPGVYSMWLRLWGARIGSLVYWSPGVTVIDRSLLRVGSRVTFGMGVRINPHAIALRGGTTALLIAPITIGDDVLVGGYSLLLPGSSIAAGEITPPLRSLHAFSRWHGGRRATSGVDRLEEEAG